MFRFRILIVEDRKDVLEQCVRLLRRALPGAMFDVARSVEDALGVIRDALSRGVVYDLAILDFKLPQRIGEKDSVDETICKELSRVMKSTIVGHMTAFAAHQEIAEHMKKAHPQTAPRGFCLDKTSDDFSETIVPIVRATLYGVEVERRIDRLFNTSDGVGREGARISGHQRGASVTNGISDLCLDIGATWDHLSESTRGKVQEHFNVHDAEGVVSVVLK
jgi:hypothetical protein